MAQNELNNYPALYISRLPDQVVISNGGYDYRIDGDNATCTDNATGDEESIILKLRLLPGDPFAEGAVAKLPNGLSYLKTGNVWLLAPLRVPKPVILAEDVGGRQYSGYRFIREALYTVGSTGPVKMPWVIRLNVPMSAAKGGVFPGTDKPAFPHIPGRTTFEEKLSIVMSLAIKSSDEKLVASCEVDVGVTKSQLAKAIAREMEKTLDTPNQVLLVFGSMGCLRQHVLFKFDDLLLGEFVQRAEGAFHVVIAVRVPPSDDTRF